MSLDRKCRFCGEDFLATRANQQFCSSSCREKKWNRDDKPRYKPAEIPCKECGAVFLAEKSNRCFCSWKCNYSFHNKKRDTTKREERTCPECGKTFFPMQRRGVGRTYCTIKCKKHHQYEQRKESNPSRYESWAKHNEWDTNRQEALKRDDYTCQVCRKRIYPSQSTKTNKLIVHHRDGSGESDNKNHGMDNLMTLCETCHREYHLKIRLVFMDGEYFVRGKIFGLLGLTSVKAAT